MREGAACEAARHAPWAELGYSAGRGQMHRSVGRGVPGISATAPVTIGEGSITGGWGGDFEIDYWSLLPAGVRVWYMYSLYRILDAGPTWVRSTDRRALPRSVSC
eukprot:SAG25_NODE_699_length_5883_cov_3.452282_3_plen_105_part_00